MHIGQFITPKDVMLIKNTTQKYATEILRVIAKENNLFRKSKSGTVNITKTNKVMFSYRKVTIQMYADYYNLTVKEVLEAYQRGVDAQKKPIKPNNPTEKKAGDEGDNPD